MITAEENDLLCLVEGNTAMGGIMRNHWLPACMSEEVFEKDGKPARVRLLGEDLVVFRDTKGRLGAIDEFCRHRGASLAFGRNEDCGASEGRASAATSLARDPGAAMRLLPIGPDHAGRRDAQGFPRAER